MQTRNSSLILSQRKLMACPKEDLLFLGALTYACDIGSGMCFVYSLISAIASQDESGALWMNWSSHSMRRMSMRWMTSAIKAGNTRTGSSMCRGSFLSASSLQSFSHSISLKDQHLNTWRIGARRSGTRRAIHAHQFACCYQRKWFAGHPIYPFSVKEYLTSTRLSKAKDTVSRFHISMTSAHTIVAQASLGVLLYLDEKVTKISLERFLFADYAAEHWWAHARFEGASPNIQDGMKCPFDPRIHHFST